MVGSSHKARTPAVETTATSINLPARRAHLPATVGATRRAACPDGISRSYPKFPVNRRDDQARHVNSPICDAHGSRYATTRAACLDTGATTWQPTRHTKAGIPKKAPQARFLMQTSGDMSPTLLETPRGVPVSLVSGCLLWRPQVGSAVTPSPRLSHPMISNALRLSPA